MKINYEIELIANLHLHLQNDVGETPRPPGKICPPHSKNAAEAHVCLTSPNTRNALSLTHCLSLSHTHSSEMFLS